MKRSLVCLVVGMLLASGLTIDARSAYGKPISENPDTEEVKQTETYEDRPELSTFVGEMAQQGLDPIWVWQTLSKARKLESVRQAIEPLATGQRKNWRAYRERFVNPNRTQAGKDFMQQHADTLARASQQYGVPVEVIVGILGVESWYGRDTGRYRVIDVLATLTFDYPVESGRDRSPYFRKQLVHFLMWCSAVQCEPEKVKGSYAGAIGLPQFMPENIYRYGTDFDGDGQVNLHNPSDAIGSVARFLASNGWIKGLEPIVVEVDLENAQLQTLLEPGIIPTFTLHQLLHYGVRPRLPLPAIEKYALIELQNGDEASEYVLGNRNFYVLTRYNHSSYYAMAVLALGREVVAAQSASTLAKGTNCKG